MLVRGTEGLLADRAVDRLTALAREEDPTVEITRIEAVAYEKGQLDTLTSPSLFEENRLLIAQGAEQMTDAFLDDVLAYLTAPAPDVRVLIRHDGGQRGKKLLDAIGAAGFPPRHPHRPILSSSLLCSLQVAYYQWILLLLLSVYGFFFQLICQHFHPVIHRGRVGLFLFPGDRCSSKNDFLKFPSSSFPSSLPG